MKRRFPKVLVISLATAAILALLYWGYLKYEAGLPEEEQSRRMWFALMQGDTAEVKFRIEVCPELVNEVGNTGGTPIFVGVNGMDNNLVAFLLNHGADPNVHNKNIGGLTPLHKASLWSGEDQWMRAPSLENARLLLSHGAQVNVICDTGDTPLHLAVHGGNEEMILLLVSQGANPLIANAKGETPLSIATAAQNQMIINILTKNIHDHTLPVK